VQQQRTGHAPSTRGDVAGHDQACRSRMRKAIVGRPAGT
jgi:hypothetical protein